MKRTQLNYFIVFLFLGFLLQGQTLSGELKRWHKVTVTFNGPNTSETANPNPFSDYRLEVTFTHQSSNRSYTVPGYFAACGNAENNSCNSGNKWKVHFAPDQTGSWSWSASFKQGSNVAINGGGAGAGFMDGANGTINIEESNKSGRDFRSKDLGRITYVGEHYLKHIGTNPANPNGPWFVKAGADAPENTLAYDDFDNTPNRGNRRKSWNPHQQDYVASDASAYTWDGGKGSELLGVVNYLSSKGVNALSFLTLSLHGDDENVFPHLLKVGVNTYNGYNDGQQWNQGVHKDRFDVSKMAQWEKIFEYADKKGMFLHFKTLETENDNIMDNNSFGTQRKLYYRELIARFGHHLALNWNLSEETTIPDGVVKSTASYIKDMDPYDHHIVIHTYPNQQDQRYNPLLGNSSVLTGASIQTGKNKVHDDVKRWIEKSKNAGKKWVVANDEQGSANIGVDQDPKDNKLVRQQVLWGTLLAGGMGVEYYYGYQTGETDLTAQNHRSRDAKYSDAFRALRFVNSYLQNDLIAMTSSDGVTTDNSDYVFAKAGDLYAIYRPNGGSTGLNLPSGNGNYDVQWYNPRGGSGLSTKVTLGNNLVAPDNNDWVALIKRKGGSDGGDGDECIALEQNGIAAVEAEHFVSQSKTTDRKWYVLNGTGATPTPDPDPSHHGSASEGGYLEILPDTRVTHGDPLQNGVNFSNSPGQVAIIDYKVKFTTPGKYFVWVRAYSTGTEDNGVHVGIDGTWPASGQRMQWCAGKNQWTWESKQRTDANHCGEPEKIFINVPTAGIHTISFSMREDGFEMDKFVLSKSYTKPVGAGPAEVLTDCSDGGDGGDGGECQAIALNAISDFPNTNVSGFSPAYIDNTRGALAIDASQYKDKFAAAETTFSGVTAAYDIKLNTLTEIDGESTYNVVVDGVTVGTFTNPTTTTDYTAAGTTFNNINIANGAIIRVEFNSHTNGQIPEGNSTAYSRGRWTSLELTCSAGDTGGDNKPPTVVITDPDQSNYNVGENIAVQVNANDADGSITKYQVYVNNQLVDTDGGNYTPHVIANVQEGSYEVKVTVTDNEGATATATKSFTVGDQTPPGIAIPGMFEAEAFTSKSGSVKIEDTPGTNSEQNIGFIRNGDYTAYNVDVNSNGNYSFEIMASSAGVGGTIDIIEGNNVVGSIAIPVTGQWHNYKSYTVDVPLSSGQKTLKLLYKGAAGYLFNVDKVTVIKVEEPVEQTISLTPIHDAFIQGSTSYNSAIVRLEQNKRTAYLMFDLSQINGVVTKADLKFTVTSDPGNGNTEVRKGNSDNWTENNLTNANKPALGELVGSLNTSYNLNSRKNISLEAGAVSGNKLTLVMEMTSGNDFAFASKENTAAAKPELVITYVTNAAVVDDNKEKPEDGKEDITIYPNPAKSSINLTVNESRLVKIFNSVGMLQKEVMIEKYSSEIDIRDLSAGYYIINIMNPENTNQIISTKTIIKQ